ncbi:hypothetical protein HpCK102_00180 [Helicobacter pylori]
MIEINALLQKLDDALDKIVPKKEPESFLKPIVSPIEEYQKSVSRFKRNSQTRQSSMKRALTLNF